MSEQPITNVHASVVVYDDNSKKWIPSGSSGTAGVSKVQIFHHLQMNTFRVVGRKTSQDHEVVINCAISRGLNYNRTTKTFHQWRDKRQVYGLNFVSVDDAAAFADAMQKALQVLANSSDPTPTAAVAAGDSRPVLAHCQMSNGAATPNDYDTTYNARDSANYSQYQHQNGSLSVSSNGLTAQYQHNNGHEPQQGTYNNGHAVGQHHPHHHLSASSTASSSSTSFTQDQTNNAEKTYDSIITYAESYRSGPGGDDLCYTVGNVSLSTGSQHVNGQQQQQQYHQRRSSQGSNNSTLSSGGSSAGSGLYNTNVIYSSSTIQNTATATGHHPRVVPVAPAPPPPPASGLIQPGGRSTVGPPAAPKPPATNIPTPPPLPAASTIGSTLTLIAATAAEKPSTPPSANNLAQAIASTKLRKVSCKPAGTAPESIKENRSSSTGAVDSNGLRVNASQPQHSSIISEMAATLARRRMMLQESNNGSPPTESRNSDSPTNALERSETKKSLGDIRMNRLDDKSNVDSPKTHRKVPSGSSLSSQEEGVLGLSIAPTPHHSHGGSSASLVNLPSTPALSGTQRSLSNGPSIGFSAAAGVQPLAATSGVLLDAVEQMKREILSEMRAEMTKAKNEIIEALKAELNRR